MTDRYEKIRKALAKGPMQGPWGATLRDLLAERDALAAENEALRAEVAEAAKVLRGALDASTDGEPLRVLAIRASNALYWRTESAERAKARAERLADALREAYGQVRELCDCYGHAYPEASFVRYEALLREQEEGHEQ